MADDDKNTDAMKALEEKMAAMQATMQAKIDALEGKSAGILGDKKKEQAAKDALQAEIDELKSKDLGEVDRLKLENERMQSRVEAAEKLASEASETLTSTQRKNALNDISKQFKWMDNVPENLRALTLSNEFDGVDLGNEVLVADKVKTITSNYAGLLAANVPDGAGQKPGTHTPNQNTMTADQIAKPDLSKVASDPLAYILEAAEANSNQ